jgi:hypothetical protein
MLHQLGLGEEHSMCVDESARHNPHRLRHDVGPVEVVGLEPVEAVTVTTVMDNSLDLFMPDQGPAHRVGPDRMRPARPCPVRPTGWARTGCVPPGRAR